jgi:magnesium transporter
MSEEKELSIPQEISSVENSATLEHAERLRAIQKQVQELILKRDLHDLRDILSELAPADIAEVLEEISNDDQVIVFRILPRDLASDVFSELASEIQEALVHALGDQRIAVLLNEMSADDRTAFFEELPAAAVRKLLLLLNREERTIASSLLGYPETSVGRHMTPDYVMVKPDMSVQKVLEHVRKYGQDSDSLNHIYVVDDSGILIDDIRIRDILLASPDTLVSDLMHEAVVKIFATQDQEDAVELFKKYDRTVLPVTDLQGIMLGIITIDDVFDIAEEETTEDIQKLGAVEALDDPYMQTSMLNLVRKRANWLIFLFIGEMFTASAMSYFEDEIARAVVLALFVPLIISSGGNAGSQASTLVIRALAIGEIEIKDWYKVFLRELPSGLILGLILGCIGFIRILIWQSAFHIYGEHWMLVASTVCISLVGVVLWGSLTGSMLPFILKKMGADPATSSAPFVATLVDVTGLVIYFSVAEYFLSPMFR